MSAHCDFCGAPARAGVPVVITLDSRAEVGMYLKTACTQACAADALTAHRADFVIGRKAEWAIMMRQLHEAEARVAKLDAELRKINARRAELELALERTVLAHPVSAATVRGN